MRRGEQERIAKMGSVMSRLILCFALRRFTSGRSLSTGSSGSPKKSDIELRNTFMKANFTNMAWELKACKQLLAVNSYMGSDLQQGEASTGNPDSTKNPLTHSTLHLLADSIISKIMDSAHYILNCDRVSLYLVDHVSSTLTCVHSRDEIKNIKIPIGTGIVGEVARTGRPLNIRDAYKDTRFFPGVDRQTGYRTKGIICFPVKFNDVANRVGAVIQAINKKAPKVRSSEERAEEMQSSAFF